MKANLAASIRARLLNKAKERHEDFNFTLDRFAVERFLVRLSMSRWANDFVLKGALLFDLWFREPHRPTHDADFLGMGPQDAASLAKAVREICAIPVEDGIRFDVETMKIEPTLEDTQYKGLRVRLVGELESSRCNLQLDVGYGDAMISPPVELAYPSILDDLPSATVRCYSRETVFAEKLEAIASLGIANSRMKDFYDLHALIREGRLDETALAKGIGATFTRRGTPFRLDAVGLSEEFSRDSGKNTQWRAFLGKNRLEGSELPEVVAAIRGYIGAIRQFRG